MSAATALTIVATTIVLGVALMWFLIAAQRRGAYQHWPSPLRWAFFALRWSVALLGAWLWIMRWYTVSPLAGLAQFAICASIFWDQVIAPWRASASPETTPPRPTA